MFKDTKNQFGKRKKVELKNTPGETVRDAILSAGVKVTEESAYAAGNSTEKFIALASNAGDLGTKLIVGGEASNALGRIAYKAAKDVARGDSVCTGLCAVSCACETVALGCSTIKVIPFRGKIYTGAKIISKGCMTYRNLCAGDGC